MKARRYETTNLLEGGECDSLGQVLFLVVVGPVGLLVGL